MNGSQRTLILDCDGVLADTERDGHLVAFNAMFAELGLPWRWSDEQYARLVRIGGGKERLAAALTPAAIAQAGLPDDPAGLAEVIAHWHRRKSDAYRGLIESGAIPPRPGVRRLILEALASGWRVAVASTSAHESVEAVLVHAIGPEAAAAVPIYAGDTVAHKKPAPDIYLHALHELGASPENTIVIEDSGVGLAASRAAGLATVVTISAYTAGDSFEDADLVVTNLGEDDAPAVVVSDPYAVGPLARIDVGVLERLLERHVGRHEDPLQARTPLS